MDKCYITIIQLHEQYMFQSDFKIKPYSEKYFHIKKKKRGVCCTLSIILEYRLKK